MPQLHDIQMRDPFVLVDQGAYYLFGSTDPNIWQAPGVGFDVYRAAPGVLTEFDGPYPAFRPAADFWSITNFWAPEVYRWDDAYIMFATFQPTVGRRGTAVLRSPSPLGPFTPWSDGPVTPPEWECLDGTLYVEADGPVMVFCHEWQQIGDGAICAIRLSDDLRAAVGPPEVLFTASQAPWTSPLKGRAPGSYVTDGPFLYRGRSPANGGENNVIEEPSPVTLYLLWSSFGAADNYCLGVATSESGTLAGPWRQSQQPLYEGDGGHGMVFTGPDGSLYLALHTPNTTPDERPIFIALTQGPTGLAATSRTIR